MAGIVVWLAEREGFEPSVEILSLRRFSKPLPSATRPPLRVRFSINYASLAFAFRVRNEYLAEKVFRAALHPAGIDLYGMPLVVVNPIPRWAGGDAG